MYPSQQNATDQSSNFFWLLVMICGAFIAIWVFKPQWIIAPIFFVRETEITLIQWVMAPLITLCSWLHLSAPDLSNLVKIKHYMSTVDFSKEKFEYFSAINDFVGKWTRYPVILILFSMAGYSYFLYEGARFREEYSMKSLRSAEASNWPQITPVVSLDLVKEDCEKGPWAMAKAPLDFAESNEFLVKKTEDGKIVWDIDEKVASRVFAMQLGRRYENIESLPIYIKALLVVFVSRAKKDSKTAKHFLSQIARSSASGKLDFTGVEEALATIKKDSIISWVTERHAYVTGVMATLLELGRTSGVLASSEFLWLKPVDRRLWYMLNSIGRQTSVTEISGAFSHWLAEKRMERPLKTPMVKQAVIAMRLAIIEILYVDKGKLWHSNAD